MGSQQDDTARVKATTPAQRVALFLGHASSVTSVVLTLIWASGKDKTKSYMGGLDWSDKSLIFNYHPVLMTIGLVFCSTEGMLAYRTFALGKATNKVLHLSWQTAAIIFLSVGLRAVFKNHALNHNADLYTAHSWLGIAVVSLFCLNYVIGVVVFFLPLASQRLRASVLPYHVFLGLSVYMASVFTTATGVIEKIAFKGKCQKTPGINYGAIAEGCRVADWLVVSLLATVLFTFFALYDYPRYHQISSSALQDNKHHLLTQHVEDGGQSPHEHGDDDDDEGDHRPDNKT